MEEIEVQLGDPYSYYFEFTTIITDFPEWAIPFVRVTCDGHPTDSTSIDPNNDDQNAYVNLAYHWQPQLFNPSTSEEEFFTLYVDVKGRFSEKERVGTGYSFVARPFYLNLYLTLFNERIFDGIQPKKI